MTGGLPQHRATVPGSQELVTQEGKEGGGQSLPTSKLKRTRGAPGQKNPGGKSTGGSLLSRQAVVARPERIME